MEMFARLVRWIIRTILLVCVLAAAGFALFLASIAPATLPDGRKADGIVALTGGKARIGEAVKLLADKRAMRMLITGVNPSTTKEQLGRLVRQGRDLFECCIDLGREAEDTTGNAVETRDWTRLHGYKSLIVVTSSYHMPRALAELKRHLPGVDIVPHAVVPNSFRSSRWWADEHVMRLIVTEYVKFLPALARLGFTRLTNGAGISA